jgi:hypothetical protein
MHTPIKWMLLGMLSVPALAQGGQTLAGPSTLAGPQAAAPATLTVTLVGSCAVSSGSSSTASCTPSAGGSVGDLILFSSKITNTSGTPTVAFSSAQCAATPIPLIFVNANGTGSALAQATYGCLSSSTTAASATVTWTGSTGTSPQLSVGIQHSTGGWNTPLLDVSNSSVNASSVNCPTGSAGTTRNPNDFIYVTCSTNGTATFQHLSLTPLTAMNANAIGNYGQLTNATQVQSYSPTTAAAIANAGGVVALQAQAPVNCAGCTFTSGSISSQTATFDHLSASGVTNGSSFVYFGVHSNGTGSGTTTMSDATGLNLWYECANPSNFGTSVTANDMYLNSTNGMFCFFSPSVLSGTTSTIAGQPTATDCSGTCTLVGSVLVRFSGTFNWEAFGHSALNATSGTGSNNASCSAMTTATANDFILNFVYAPSVPTYTAGTSPITFTQPTLNSAAVGVINYAIWSSSGSITPAVTLSTSSTAYGDMCLAFR